MKKESPLVSRLRPRILDEIAGQQHIVGKGKLLYRTIQADKLGFIIFYGPPGTGKTILAKVIVNIVSANSRQTDATVTGKKDTEEVTKEAKGNIGMCGRKATLFVDEIHRFNRGQQDYLLPFVENGTLILIRATTENPYFEINGALPSRPRVFELKLPEKEDVKELIHRVVYDKEQGVDIYDADIGENAADFLIDTVNGDVGATLNAVELGILTTAKGADGWIHIDTAMVQECVQKRTIRYGKDENNYYDTISAFTKSIQGPDPDTAVYYLARILHAGEDIEFIVRRIMIRIMEDVGNVNPQVLVVAASVARAVERIGVPEANIILSQAVTYVATALKNSAACMTAQEAMGTVRNERTVSIPVHLQSKHRKGAEKLGHGADYLYTHDYLKHYVQQQYLPEGIGGTVFYEPSDNGYEKRINTYMKWLKS